MMSIPIRSLFWGGLFVGILGTVIVLGFLHVVAEWRRAPVSPLVKYQVCDQLSDIAANLFHALEGMSPERRNRFLHNVMQLEPQGDVLKNLLLIVYGMHEAGHGLEALQTLMRWDCNRKMGKVWETLE